MKSDGSTGEEGFSLASGGLLDRALARAGLSGSRRLLAVLVAVCWLPLLILSAAQGLARGDRVPVPFLLDIAVHVRFLFAMPLLVLGLRPVAARLSADLRQVGTSQLVPEREIPELRSAIEHASRWKDSAAVELVLLLLVVLSSLRPLDVVQEWTRFTWAGVLRGGSWELTAPGWWYATVSRPIFQLLLYRWLWRFLVWCGLLRRIARLDLQLRPAHPDQAGGLAFLGAGQAWFSVFILAASSVLAAGAANRVLHGGESVLSFRLVIAVFVVMSTAIFMGPLLVFTRRLVEVRRLGLLAYGALGTRYSRDFDERWLRGTSGSPLGTADIQSLADLANSVDVVRRMRVVPLNLRNLAVPVAAGALPFLPLITTLIPLDQLVRDIVTTIL